MNDECKISSYSEHIAKHMYIASISLEQLLVNIEMQCDATRLVEFSRKILANATGLTLCTYVGQDKERGRYNTCRYVLLFFPGRLHVPNELTAYIHET